MPTFSWSYHDWPGLSLLESSTVPCSRVSYSQERHLFHIVVRDGITFLCMADEVRACTPALRDTGKCMTVLYSSGNRDAFEISRQSSHVAVLQDFGRRIPFAFLEDVRERCHSALSACMSPVICQTPLMPSVLSRHTTHITNTQIRASVHHQRPSRSRYLTRFGEEAHTAPAYEHNAEFSRVLEDRMAFYSTDQRADTINRVRGEISEVKTVMIENIDKVGLPILLSRSSTICSMIGPLWGLLQGPQKRVLAIKLLF